MNKSKKLIGHVSVDSGTIWVGDPCYILYGEKPKSIGKNWFELCDITNKLPISFNHDLGHEGLGVMSRTMCGDGFYPVYMIGENEGLYIDFR